MKEKTRSLLCGILVFLSGMLVTPVQGSMLPPEKQSVAVGEPLRFNFPAPFEKSVRAEIYGDESHVPQFKEGKPTEFSLQASPVPAEPGEFQVRLSLFGLLPVRDMIVSVVPQIKLIPGGQSIGVLLHSQGVIVVGYSPVLDQEERKVNPALEAGIVKDDVILKIDGEAVQSDAQVRKLVAAAGTASRTLSLEVKRGEEVFTTKVKPIFCKETLRYRIGIMIRDSAAGVGTLTFYEPQSMSYGALGHVITDIGTTRPVELSDGKIVGAAVQGIHRGKRGQPGEKVGVFHGDQKISGTITRNTKLGIFGCLQKPLDNPVFNEPVPVALAQEIHEGKAEILTVLQGEKVEKYEIEILKINLQARQDGKGLIIKITDPRLLEQTGGIIQGMSGSPILQDNKLIGAVTHVFVNDPTRGYGVPVEWMLWEGELLSREGSRETEKLAG